MSYQTKIKELRTDRDLTQEQVAKYLGIQQKVYSRYETGINEMPIRHLIELCKIYKISADYILGLPDDYEYPNRE